MKLDYTFLVGGEAGQGLQTIGAVHGSAGRTAAHGI